MYQYLKELRALCCVLILVMVAFAVPLYSQMQKPSLPDPIKFFSRKDLVMRASRAVLEQMGYQIELDDPKGGRMITKPYEFVSGALTSSEVDKVASKTDSMTGSWLKANCVVEASFEMVSTAETLVTVRTNMKGLNRETDGSEKWMDLQSLGSVEKRVLGKISMKLMGTEPVFKDNKSFWEKKPAAPPNVIKKQPV
jgi:hypothetical protein